MRPHELGTVSRTLAFGAMFLGLLGLATSAAAVERYGDFNGDGFSDLAVGVPGEGVHFQGAGAVNVAYGGPGGLPAGGDQIWTQDTTGIADLEERYDAFGASVATGDFNGDTYGDLAIGAPFEDVLAVGDAGAVHVLYGSALGLTSSGSQLFTQDTPGIADTAEADDAFGFAVVAGDFDGDGFVDLAIGIPGEDASAGAVAVLYGSLTGLVTGGNQLWRQGIGLLDAAEPGDAFGHALAAGDYDGNHAVDLAVGVPGEDFVRLDLVEVFEAGAVAVIYADFDGLGIGDQIWTQDIPHVLGISEHGDSFGNTLAAGDFNGDDCDDLAIGAPHDNVATGFGSGFVGRILDAGAVNVLYGLHDGLNVFRNQWFHEESPGMSDTSEPGDYFSVGLGTGDFNSDGFDDLAIGVSHETFGKPGKDILRAGSVHVLYGSADCLPTAGEQRWHQGRAGVPGANELWDLFGASLSAGDFDGDGFEDLAIGAPGEAVSGEKAAGTVTTLEGRASGLTVNGSRVLHQNTSGVHSQPHPDDYFGFATASH